MTSNKPCIAVLGARGAIGQQVIAQLAAVAQVRAGSRRPPAVQHAGVEYHSVDLYDSGALAAFCTGCCLIINCAAPGSRIGDRVARIAEKTGCDYLDPGGDDHLFALLHNKVAPAQRYVLSAGMLPGLSGLLLQSAASAFDTLESVTGYALSCEPYSPGGAADVIASLDNGYGTAGVALRQGMLQPCAGIDNIQLPLAQTRASGSPFMTSEWQRIGARFPQTDLTWYNLFAADDVAGWLSRRDLHRADAAQTLVALSVRAFAGSPAQHLLAVEARGEIRGEPQQRACVLESDSGAKLTAAVTVFCALQMLQSGLPAGVHFAADVLHPAQTLQFIQQQLPGFCWLELPALTASEEGVL